MYEAALHSRLMVCRPPFLLLIGKLHESTTNDKITPCCHSNTKAMSDPVIPDEISSKARNVSLGFSSLLDFVSIASKDQHSLDNNRAKHHATIEDAQERYELWAGNLGAKHTATSTRSLEYRLRDAIPVKTRICELLDEILGLQQTCRCGLYHMPSSPGLK